MNKQQFKNLSHAYRWMRRRVGAKMSLLWISHLSLRDGYILSQTIANGV